MSSTDVQPVCGLEETFLDCIRPKEGIVNTFCFVWDGKDNFIISSGVAVTLGNVLLWGYAVSLSSPRGDE